MILAHLGRADVINAKVKCSFPTEAFHLRVGLDEPCGFLPNQNIMCL